MDLRRSLDLLAATTLRERLMEKSSLSALVSWCSTHLHCFGNYGESRHNMSSVIGKSTLRYRAHLTSSSMGEYAAFVVAGALSLDVALLLVARRAQLMVSHCALAKSGMVACKLSTKAAQSELRQIFGEAERLVVACDNSPEDCVVAGDVDDLTTFLGHCKTMGIKALRLRVPFGFHSSAMAPMTDAFRQLCSGIKMQQSKIPIISSHLGKLVQTESLTADYLANHTRHAVNFSDAIRDLASSTGGQKMRIVEIGHTSGSEYLSHSSQCQWLT